MLVPMNCELNEARLYVCKCIMVYRIRWRSLSVRKTGIVKRARAPTYTCLCTHMGACHSILDALSGEYKSRPEPLIERRKEGRRESADEID